MDQIMEKQQEIFLGIEVCEDFDGPIKTLKEFKELPLLKFLLENDLDIEAEFRRKSILVLAIFAKFLLF